MILDSDLGFQNRFSGKCTRLFWVANPLGFMLHDWFIEDEGLVYYFDDFPFDFGRVDDIRVRPWLEGGRLRPGSLGQLLPLCWRLYFIQAQQRSPMWTSLPLQFSMHSFHTRGRSLLHVQKCIWKECRLWMGTWVGLWLHSRPYLWSFFGLWRGNTVKKKTFARYWKILQKKKFKMLVQFISYLLYIYAHKYTFVYLYPWFFLMTRYSYWKPRNILTLLTVRLGLHIITHHKTIIGFVKKQKFDYCCRRLSFRIVLIIINVLHLSMKIVLMAKTFRLFADGTSMVCIFSVIINISTIS